MDVACKSCGATLKIPDEKLPPNQIVNVTCPKCKGKIRIDTSELDTGQASKADGGTKTADLAIDKDASPLDFFEEGTKLALFLHGDGAETEEITSALEQLSYKPIAVQSANEALGKLRLHNFDLVILSDGVEGQDITNSPVAHYLNHISMSIRRKVFLVLLSQKFKTLDDMMAFALSANLVVNPEDSPKLGPILNKAISEHEKFYKVFTDTLKEVGRE